MSKVPNRARPADRSRTRPSRRTPGHKSRLGDLALESLERRALMAVLPPVTVTGQLNISGGSGNQVSPSVAIDPNNPQKLVSVWVDDNPANAMNNGQTPVFIQGAFTINGGQSWTPLSGLNNTQIDFNRNQNGGPFFMPRVTDASVAFGPGDQFYVLSMLHNDADASGEVQLQKYDFAGVNATLKTLAPNISGKAPTPVTANPVYEWSGLNPAFKPTLAVDANRSSFNDTNSAGQAYDQADPFVGNVYVAWSTNNNTGNVANGNPNVIDLTGSGDGGNTFAAPVLVNTAGNNTGIDRDASPQIVISQGRPSDPAIAGGAAVPGGQVSVIWDDTAGGRQPGAATPVDRIEANRITDGVKTADFQASDFTGANGGTATEITQNPPPATSTGAGIAQAVAVQNNPNIPVVTSFPLAVNITDPNFMVDNLNAVISLAHGSLNEISIDLVSPQGTTIRLLNNATNEAGNGTGSGIGGANLGITVSGAALGTTFDSNAVQAISQNGAGGVAHFRPDAGSLLSFAGLAGNGAAISGTWHLRITDFGVHNNPPPQNLVSWSLNFTANLTPGLEVTAATSKLQGAVANNTNPLQLAVAPDSGIGPGAVIASDNTLGAFSAHEGRLYVAFVNNSGTAPQANQVGLAFSDNGGTSWQHPNGQVNDDIPTKDGYSEGDRPKLQPAIAVDQATGTVVLSYLDTRNDAAQARVATYVGASTDGGIDFNAQTFVNPPDQAQDAIKVAGSEANTEVVRGPIPDNQSSGNPSRDTNFDFGTHQALAVFDGQVYPVWASNQNGGPSGTQLLNIHLAKSVIAAGPRVVGSTMGPIGLPGDALNPLRAADGTPELTTIQVVFDRAVDRNTFTPADFKLFYRDTNPADAPVQITNGIVITPIFVSNDPNNDGHFGFTTFNVTFPAQTGLGTYSYEVGPDVRTDIPSLVLSSGAQVTIQAASSDTPLPIPGTPGGGGTGTDSDKTTSTLTLSGHGGDLIKNLTVKVDLNYPQDSDLVLTLTPLGADGVTRKAADITLFNGGNGFFSTGADFIGTTFDDNAGQPISFGIAPFLGSFRPAQALGVLDGALLDGVYKLTVTDTQSGKVGALVDWSISAAVTVPGTTTQQPGASMDENANGTTGENPGDIYAAPRPTNGLAPGGGAPSVPFARDTLPVIIPGPSVVTTLAHHADNSAPTPAGGVVSDAGVDGLIVVFDRDMDATSLPGSAVTRVMGPAGLIPGPFTITYDQNGDPSAPDAPNHKRTFLIRFPAAQTQVLSGTYTVTFGPGLHDVHGNALDENQNAGLYLLDPSRNPSAATTQVTYNAPISASAPATITPATTGAGTGVTPGGAVATIVVTDTTPITGLTVTLNINYLNDPDLVATLFAPDGKTTVTLFSGVGQGNTNNHANFFNTTFDDNFKPVTPIANGGAPFFGTFNPQQELGSLIGAGGFNPAGTWTLKITNNGAGIGTLTRFTLNFTKPVPDSGLGEPVADLASESFRIFAMNPTNALASSVWTAVGPASIGGTGGTTGPEGGGGGGSSGRIGGIAVDPSDPSGNTVFIGGASGGIWKSTNFLSTAGPTWIPLTDFGPTFAINIGGIAIFPVNNDPNKSIIFAATGEGDTGTTGVGVLRSMDGGATWTLLDSTNNTLPFKAAAGQPQRDHAFVGTSAFKIVVDPRSTTPGTVAVYMALSGGNGGIWASYDSGQTWGLVNTANPSGPRLANLPGQATDVVLDPASATGGSGNLQGVYGALRGQGVYASTNEAQTFSQVLGNIGDPLIQDKKDDNGPVPVVPAPGSEPTPNGANGRIVLAKPFLTGNPAEDLNFQGWLYAAVVDGSSHFQGLYVTKDFGQNWTKVGIPNVAPVVTNGVAAVSATPNNNPNNPDYDLGGGPAGSGLGAQGNYDFSLAIDPTNPNVLYMGGTQDGQPTGFIRIDVTGINDPHALVPYNNRAPDGGKLENATNGDTGASAPAVTLKDPTKGITPGDFFNFFRSPSDPFGAASTLNVGNVTQFNNSGAVAKWIPFDMGGTDQHRIVTFVDPLTGHARIIIGDDQGVFSAVDNNGTFDTGIGNASDPSGSFNGNLQITQFYYGAVQPSLAAQIQGDLFIGSAQDNGGPRSSGGVLTPGDPNYGNISWNGNGGDATGVAVDQQGDSTVYQYWWPCCGGNGTNFFQVNGTGRTLGLLQSALPGPTPDPEWPSTGGSNFALNPLSGQQIAMSSQVGRIFLTENQGLTWSVIGVPTALDSTYAPAMAFGAPDPNSPDGIGNLDNFIYAGTGGGNIFVTQTGGGGAAGGGWINTTPGGLGGTVQAIVTDPTRGSHRAYAVTTQGIWYNPNTVATPAVNGKAAVPASPWINITGNIFKLTANPFGDPALNSQLLAGLSAVAADWRYVIPDNPGTSNGPTHPILYVGGEGGVFRSLDNGKTWAPFPQGATIPTAAAGAGLPTIATPDMGYLPVTDITDLQTALGAINPTTGRPQAQAGDPNVLTASTYGNGFYSIRLAPVVFTDTNLLTFGVQNLSTNPPSVTPINPGAILASTRLVVNGFSEQTAFGNVVTVDLLDETPGDTTFGRVVGSALTDPTGHFTVSIDPTQGNGLAFASNADGLKTLGVQAVDASLTAGNLVTFNFTLKRTAPLTLNPPTLSGASGTGTGGEGLTNSKTPSFVVLGPAGEPLAGPATVQLLRKLHSDPNPGDYQVVATGTGGATDGTPITIQDPGPVADNTYDYAVLQLDAAGNKAPSPSTALVVTVDTVAPPAPSAPVLAQGDVTGSVPNGTNNSRPTFIGTLPADPNAPADEPAPSVQIVQQTGLGTFAVLGSAQAVGPVGGPYTYSVTLTTPLTNTGSTPTSYTLLARAQDAAGNVGALSTGGLAGNGGVTITVSTKTPPIATLVLDPVEVQLGEATPPPANPGPGNPQVTRINQPLFFGNAGAGLKVELVEPLSPLPDPANFNDPANFKVRQGDVPVQSNGQAVAPYGVNGQGIKPADPLADGNHTLFILTSDNYGNTSLSTPLFLQVKTQGPTAAPTSFVLSPLSDSGLKGDDVTSIRRPVFNGHADPFALIDLVDLSLPGAPVQNRGVADANGNFTIALPSDLPNGRVVLAARERDVVNNSGPFGPLVFLSVVTTAGDYFGTNSADLAVFAQNTATFNIVGPGATESMPFGAAQYDIPIGGDFNGDGKDDIAIYRRNGGPNGAPVWAFAFSNGGAQAVTFGTPNSIPVPGLYDGPGRDDIGTYDPSNNHWSIFSFNYGMEYDVYFGFEANDVPVPGDYLGDGKADLAVYRPNTGQVVVLNTNAAPGTSPLVTFTLPGTKAGDVPLKGDFFGDGRDDPAVYRPSDGTWIIMRTTRLANGTIANGGIDTLKGFSGGGPDVVPVPMDFNGDGFTDIASYRRPEGNNVVGTWTILDYGARASLRTQQFIGSDWDLAVGAPESFRTPHAPSLAPAARPRIRAAAVPATALTTGPAPDHGQQALKLATAARAATPAVAVPHAAVLQAAAEKAPAAASRPRPAQTLTASIGLHYDEALALFGWH